MDRKWVYASITVFVWTIFIGHIMYRAGKIEGQEDICGPLVAEMQKTIDSEKIMSFAKDMTYLYDAGCKNIELRIVNSNNETKIAKYAGSGVKDKVQYITVIIDGVKKDFEYNMFMKKVVLVECGSNYKW